MLDFASESAVTEKILHLRDDITSGSDSCGILAACCSVYFFLNTPDASGTAHSKKKNLN